MCIRLDSCFCNRTNHFAVTCRPPPTLHKMCKNAGGRKHVVFNVQKRLQWPARLNQKGRSSILDVTMGAFDGAEVCEAAGNFLIYQLS